MVQVVKNLPAMWETWFWTLDWEDLLEKGMATHFSILAWRVPWTGDWRATACEVAKSGVQLSNQHFDFYLGNLLYLRNETTGWICVVVHNNIFTMFLRRNMKIDAGAWFFFFFNFDALTLKPESAKKKCSLYILEAWPGHKIDQLIIWSTLV